MYRTVDTSIWQDPWFVDLSPNSKCLFLYFITNPRTSACGSIELSVSQIAFETKLAPKAITKELTSFGEKVAWWPERNLIIVRNFYKRQRSNSSESFATAARKAIAALPKEAQEWVLSVYPELNPGYQAGETTQVPPSPQGVPTHGGKEEVTATVTATVTGEEEEEGEEEGEGEDAPLPPKGEHPKPHRIPDDFHVDDKMREWAAEKGFSLPEIAHHTEAFVSHWQGEATPRARKLDWRSAWRTWLMREKPGRWPGAFVGARSSPNGNPNPYLNGWKPGSGPAPRKAEDWQLIHDGRKPTWGSANGGLDAI